MYFIYFRVGLNIIADNIHRAQKPDKFTTLPICFKKVFLLQIGIYGCRIHSTYKQNGVASLFPA